MRRPLRNAAVASAALAAVLLAAAYAASGADAAWKVPRTEHAQPDLQGFWTNVTLTPLERDEEFGDNLVLSAEEAAAMERYFARFMAPKDCGLGLSFFANCEDEPFWVDPERKVMTLHGEQRSSIITEPTDGRIPSLTKEGEARLAYMHASYLHADGPEHMALADRCLMSFGSSAGPPMLPRSYENLHQYGQPRDNNMYQIVQTRDAVMIHIERVHDTRIIPLSGRRRPAGMKQWMGESLGRWEGDTLVIETTNFRREQVFHGAGENLRVTERFTRVGPHQIAYRFTIEDPTTFTRAWAGELAFNATQERMHEYACHEGNRQLPQRLAHVRELEQQQARTQPRK
jgi:hypothetical protein